MRHFEKPIHAGIAATFVAFGLAVICLWWAGPVLLHTHIGKGADEHACGEYNEAATGITILNPLRSRDPEAVADVFLHAAAIGRCAPALKEPFCSFVVQHPLPATEWRLVNRLEWQSIRKVKKMRLFYRLEAVSPEIAAKHGGCAIAHVELERIDGTWKLSGFGITPGPYNGG
jgi:hypothetical protein